MATAAFSIEDEAVAWIAEQTRFPSGVFVFGVILAGSWKM
jgi:hypothetical protein